MDAPNHPVDLESPDPVIDESLAIQTVDVRVDYGDVTAVQNLNLAIPKGAIYGLIGPNGAGKTSTIRVLATLQEPTYGEVYIGGIDAVENPRSIHRILGYVRDLPPTYDDLKCWEFLDVIAREYGLNRQDRKSQIDELLAVVNLTAKADAMAGTLSRGMKQRLAVARVLLHDPQILLLDEPASGLDPIARIELRELLKSEARRGKTVLISSHILTELAEFCTSIGVMQRGQMMMDGRIDDIQAKLGRGCRVTIGLQSPDPRFETFLRNHEHIASVVTESPLEATCHLNANPDEVADLLADLIHEKFRVIGFKEQKIDLEGIILELGAREVS